MQLFGFVPGIINTGCLCSHSGFVFSRKMSENAHMNELLSVALGIGLAAACGFRVFVPLLFVSIAAKAGKLNLVPSFQWMGTDTAMIAFAIATALEVGAYYIPWLDNFLDTIATPAAVVAGAVISASVFTGMDPFLRWTLAIIAGAGAAGAVQTASVVTRAASTASTGGFGNFLVATGELILSVVASLLAPLVALVLIVCLIVYISRKAYKRYKVAHPSEEAVTTTT
jgi:hypothetical protein